MQIRKQLAHNARAFAKDNTTCCFGSMFARFYRGPWSDDCRSGYHGIYQRIRFKARTIGHGTKVGQSKGKAGR